MSNRARRMRATLLAAAVAALACAAPASADHEPAGPPMTGGLGPPAEPSPGPSIGGSPVDGETLTAELGTWAAGTDLTSEWLRCDTAGANCVLAHDSDGSYPLTPADVGSTIVLRVRGTDPTPLLGGFRDADSAPTAEVDAISPQNTTLPTFTGIERDGQILSGSPGSWTGTPTIGLTYQWQRCTTSSPASCTDIASGGTSIDYTLTPDDVGNHVRLQETATRSQNGSDTTTASSAISGEIDAISPQNTTLPTFTGIERDGQILSGSPGGWTGTPTIGFTYQWQRCTTSSPASCTDIASGGTSIDYTLAPADVGNHVRLQETATRSQNGSDTTTASSAISGEIDAISPAFTNPPSFTGTQQDGQLLSGAPATNWTGTPTIGFTYRWQRCTSTNPASCADIGGATAINYTLTPADVGNHVRLRETGTRSENGSDTTTASSAISGEIDAISPQNTALPTFSGDEQDDHILSGSPGTWTGTPTIGLTYQWQRCSPACADIPGATSINYTLTTDDVGNKVRLQEIATRSQNGSDTNTASSLQSGVIAPIPPGSTPPTNTALPFVTGTPRDGQVLSGNPGSWTGTPTIGFTYQWQRCSPGCSNIAGATSNKYTLKPADVGKRLRLVVTAAGPGGTDAATSPQSAIVTAKPPPAKSGSVGGGSTGTTKLSKLSPFPIVAIGGRALRFGAFISQLRVSRAPRGATVTVTCKGRDCPFKRARHTIRRRSGLRLRRLERGLRRGTVIVIVIRKGNAIGKYTRLRIRRGAPPARIDRCIRPGARRPSACPS